MPCPVCRVDLAISSRDGVEIDYCPRCRGVWLDRGELDKIIERSAAPQPSFEGRGASRRADERYDQRQRGWDDEGRGGRGSWLSDLFDFGGGD
jgi:Zn-finger nucleic acid-binding protein